jgi:hypothetical protein
MLSGTSHEPATGTHARSICTGGATSEPFPRAGGAARRRRTPTVGHPASVPGAQGTKHARTHAHTRGTPLLAMPYDVNVARGAWSETLPVRRCAGTGGWAGRGRRARGDGKSGTGRSGVPCALPRAARASESAPRGQGAGTAAGTPPLRRVRVCGVVLDVPPRLAGRHGVCPSPRPYVHA